MTDVRLQRLNMVESQVRTSDVTDRRIIRAMLEVPREAFVPEALAPIAYMDEPITVSAKSNGAGVARQLLAPRTLAKLIQLAQVGEQAKVLDVGCATGYSTAILAMLAKRVVAVEADDSLAESASRALQKLGVTNAKVVPGSLLEGVPAEAPFDAIVVNGAVELVPRALLEQLKDGGRLVAVLVEGPLSRAQLTLRSGTGFDTRAAFEAPAALLPGFQAPAGFVF